MAILRTILFIISAAGIALMVASLFLQVSARELNLAVDWTEEISRFAFISMVFFAAAYSTLTRSHLRVTVFAELMIKWIGKRPIQFVHTIILLCFAGVMVVFSGLNFLDGLKYPNISPAIGFNQNHLFVAMCTGFVVIFLIHLRDLLVLMTGGTLHE
ncbi:TRAP transporter small permease subunit [Sulfitobacter sp. Ks16]|nr:TRAP transporter small permease subunit [Sulfitobacter sp. Ks16]